LVAFQLKMNMIGILLLTLKWLPADSLKREPMTSRALIALKERAMIARYRFAIIFTAIIFMLSVVSSHAKVTVNSTKTSSKSKKTARGKQQQGPAGSYIVRKGDTLNRIALAHKTTVSAIKSANNLKINKIQVGSTLKIPSKNAPQIAKSNALSATHLSKEPPPQIVETDQNQPEDSVDDPLRLQLVQAGFQFLGVRYHRGGIAESGFDCSGLVKNLFSKFNIDLPRTSREQYQQGEKIDRDKLKMGDLVFFSSGGTRPTHVGIYVGDNKFIHAALKARQVIVSDLNKIWYSMRYLGARRVIWGDDPAPEPQK
jgi:cell wall-associated NlpC family hydrolase